LSEALAVTVGEAAYRHIRGDIVFGRLTPGARLKLDRLKETYNVGTSTLREILCRLSAEGLVLAEEQRGFQVAPVSEAELRELAALRLILECSAMEQSFKAGDIEWEARVVSAHHKLSATESRIKAGDESQREIWKQYDYEFHHALVSACGSKALLDVHAGVYDRYLRYLLITVVYRGEATSREHQQLMECALKRDIKEAASILTRHVNECVAYATETTPARFMPKEPVSRRA
jgi:DNA-binding GntR family transcriptional regulator